MDMHAFRIGGYNGSSSNVCSFGISESGHAAPDRDLKELYCIRVTWSTSVSVGVRASTPSLGEIKTNLPFKVAQPVAFCSTLAPFTVFPHLPGEGL